MIKSSDSLYRPGAPSSTPRSTCALAIIGRFLNENCRQSTALGEMISPVGENCSHTTSQIKEWARGCN